MKAIFVEVLTEIHFLYGEQIYEALLPFIQNVFWSSLLLTNKTINDYLQFLNEYITKTRLINVYPVNITHDHFKKKMVAEKCPYIQYYINMHSLELDIFNKLTCNWFDCEHTSIIDIFKKYD